MHFLGEPSTGFTDRVKNILLAFAIYAVWIYLYSHFMDYMYQGQIGEAPMKLQFFMACVFAPITEEVIFRVGPIQLVKDHPKLVLPTIILSSALFGWLHYGAASWPIQGVLGFILSIVYIKNGRSYWSAVALHAMWNGYVMIVLEKLG